MFVPVVTVNQWPVFGGVGALFTAAGVLIWRLVNLSVDQEDRLLQPAYKRIEALETRMRAAEIEHEVCRRDLAKALFTLRVHGFEIEEPE